MIRVPSVLRSNDALLLLVLVALGAILYSMGFENPKNGLSILKLRQVLSKDIEKATVDINKVQRNSLD